MSSNSNSNSNIVTLPKFSGSDDSKYGGPHQAGPNNSNMNGAPSPPAQHDFAKQFNEFREKGNSAIPIWKVPVALNKREDIKSFTKRLDGSLKRKEALIKMRANAAAEERAITKHTARLAAFNVLIAEEEARGGSGDALPPPKPRARKAVKAETPKSDSRAKSVLAAENRAAKAAAESALKSKRPARKGREQKHDDPEDDGGDADDDDRGVSDDTLALMDGYYDMDAEATPVLEPLGPEEAKELVRGDKDTPPILPTVLCNDDKTNCSFPGCMSSCNGINVHLAHKDFPNHPQRCPHVMHSTCLVKYIANGSWNDICCPICKATWIKMNADPANFLYDPKLCPPQSMGLQ